MCVTICLSMVKLLSTGFCVAILPSAGTAHSCLLGNLPILPQRVWLLICSQCLVHDNPMGFFTTLPSGAFITRVQQKGVKRKTLADSLCSIQ